MPYEELKLLISPGYNFVRNKIDYKFYFFALSTIIREFYENTINFNWKQRPLETKEHGCYKNSGQRKKVGKPKKKT